MERIAHQRRGTRQNNPGSRAHQARHHGLQRNLSSSQHPPPTLVQPTSMATTLRPERTPAPSKAWRATCQCRQTQACHPRQRRRSCSSSSRFFEGLGCYATGTTRRSRKTRPGPRPWTGPGSRRQPWEAQEKRRARRQRRGRPTNDTRIPHGCGNRQGRCRHEIRRARSRHQGGGGGGRLRRCRAAACWVQQTSKAQGPIHVRSPKVQQARGLGHDRRRGL